MILGKKRRLGRKVEEITVGEKLKLTEKIEDKDLLLYLGLTNDGNPLYIQHDYASQTPYENPIVPTIMLTGIISSAISKYLPGPGSHIVEQHLEFPKPVYHYAMIDFLLEVIVVDQLNNKIIVRVEALDTDNEVVVAGEVKVVPPIVENRLNSQTMENF